MILVVREASKIISLTTAGTATNVRVSINYEWGDVVKEEAVVSAGPGTSFSYTLTSSDTASAGAHKLIWRYVILGIEYTTTVWYEVYSPYATQTAFFDANSYLDKTRFQESFPTVERIIRKTIDDFCNQSFQFINGKTLTLDGSGKRTLNTIYRLDNFTQVLRNNEDDITEEVEAMPESKFYIRKKIPDTTGSGATIWDDPVSTFFSKKKVYAITGGFGWPYVPQSVCDAAEILIRDEFNQDSVHRKHRITFAGIGPVQTRYHQDLNGTTGNIEADILLLDYSRWLMEQI